ncbi:MPPV-091 putative RNA phosphatase [Magpiepox virus 2]|nr:MPPV-091 putative RNA phosphatase [Magpiepox virus 2]
MIKLLQILNRFHLEDLINYLTDNRFKLLFQVL